MTQQERDNLKDRLCQAIAQSPHGRLIRKAALFGSYAYGSPRPDSDIDLLVEFDTKARVGFFKLVRLQRELEARMGASIDLVTPGALNKHFKEEVLRKALPVYEI